MNLNYSEQDCQISPGYQCGLPDLDWDTSGDLGGCMCVCVEPGVDRDLSGYNPIEFTLQIIHFLQDIDLCSLYLCSCNFRVSLVPYRGCHP